MGRTLVTFTQLLNQEIDSWRRYRRALRQEDQTVLDALFAAARRHTAAGAYLTREVPFEVMLISMLLEEHKQLLALQRKVSDLEARLLDHPPDGMAP